MPKKMVKNYKIVPLSLGAVTLEKIEDLLVKYNAWKWKTQMLKGNRSELCELLINISLPVVEQMLESGTMLQDNGLVTTTILNSRKIPSTIGELTNEDLEILENGEE